MSNYGGGVQTPEFNKAKNDLLSIGIELDDDLIHRLQHNLGIERIFSVARKTATLMKDKPHPGTGGTPNIIYRNVTVNNDASGASVTPFKSMTHADSRFSESILKDLSNRISVVEPQNRPALDKLLETFSVLYARSPDRFVARLLGHKYKSTDKTDANSISKIALKARYVNEQDFSTMITRVDKLISPTLSRSLFLLLCEEKNFAHNKKRAVIDLWGFFTLLKTASEQSRRSFDSKTSKIASDVEFWEKKATTTPHKSGHKSQTQYSGWMDNVPNPESEMVMAEHNKRFNGEANSVHGNGQRQQQQQQRSGYKPGLRLPVQAPATIAELLGVTEFKHVNDTSHGRKVMGNLKNEFQDRCDVPGALNSPLKSRPASASAAVQGATGAGAAGARTAARVRTVSGSSCFGTSERPSTSSGSSSSSRTGGGGHGGSAQVGAALGYEQPVRPATAHESVRRPAEVDVAERQGIFGAYPVRSNSVGRASARPHAASSNALRREWDARSSVASVLGCSREDGTFPTKGGAAAAGGGAGGGVGGAGGKRNSFGSLARDYSSKSVASVMGCEREDVAGRLCNLGVRREVW
jgi:hypothetical protein